MYNVNRHINCLIDIILALALIDCDQYITLRFVRSTKILDEELERDLSTLAFIELFLLLSAFMFTVGGEADISRDELSGRGVLCGSQGAIKFISVFSAWL